MKHLWRKEQKEKKMSLFLETLKVYRDEISFTASKAQAQALFYIGLFRALMPPNLIWIKNCLKILKYFCLHAAST